MLTIIWYSFCPLTRGLVDENSIVVENGYAYIKGMQKDCLYILKELKEKSQERVAEYQQTFSQWLDENPLVGKAYDGEKNCFLIKLFQIQKQ